MSSTFMTRLMVGDRLVDAKGVSELAKRRIGAWPLVVICLAGLLAIAAAVAASPGLRHAIQLLDLRLRDLLGI
jgi:uncharacterized membrane-anchored protein